MPDFPSTTSASGIWTLKKHKRAKQGGNWPDTSNPYFPYVTMLLSGNGTNGAQNNTFLDSSTNNFTITRNGNTTQGTFAPYGANWSNYFDGTDDQLVAPDNSAFAFGTGDFTLEAWIYKTVTTSDSTILANIASSTDNNEALWLYINNNNAVVTATWFTVLSTSASNAVTNNTWIHVAWCRSGTNTSVWVNGTRVSNYTLSNNLSRTTGYRVGAYNNGATISGDFSGYISNARVVKGTAVYDPSQTTITVPTAPLTAITNTSLLTCQSNRFIDNSANNFTITRNGDVSAQVFSPFSPTASYAAGTIGGSGYFDGTGDYLDVANDNTFDTNSTYTLECWFYQPAAGNAMLFNRGGGTGNWSTSNGYQFTLLILSGLLYWQWNNSGVPTGVSVTTPTAGAWHHVAIGYNGTTTRVWVDGASIGTSTTAYTLPSTRNIIRVGTDQSTPSSNSLTGYISGLRFVKGTDVYGVGNTTITVPTAPLTAISNTQLLLNYTNAGVIDNAMMNNLETVGNAQISTTQSKWGGSSIAFDGTGDVLISKELGAAFTYGTGDYTIEFWVYPTTGATNQRAILGRENTGNVSVPYIYLKQTSGYLAVYYSSDITSTSSAIAQNTWTHIAVCRASGTTRIFVNGTQDGSGADTTNLISPNFITIGASGSGASVPFTGYLDDFRITKGFARYTANFTPPPGPFFTR